MKLISPVFSKRSSTVADINAIERRLEMWNTNLPTELRSQDCEFARANIHLQIMYNMIWVDLGRRSLLSTVKQALSPAVARYTSRSIDNSKQQSRLAALCVSSAQAVLELIQSLRHLDMLASFSHTDFNACSSAVVLMLLDSALHHRSDYSSTLIQYGIETMEILASGNDYARKGVRLVKRFHKMLGKLAPDKVALPQRAADSIPQHRRSSLARRTGPLDYVEHASQSSDLEALQVDDFDFQYVGIDFSDGTSGLTPDSWTMDRDYEVADFVALEAIAKMHPDIWVDDQLPPDLTFEHFSVTTEPPLQSEPAQGSQLFYQ